MGEQTNGTKLRESLGYGVNWLKATDFKISHYMKAYHDAEQREPKLYDLEGYKVYLVERLLGCTYGESIVAFELYAKETAVINGKTFSCTDYATSPICLIGRKVNRKQLCHKKNSYVLSEMDTHNLDFAVLLRNHKYTPLYSYNMLWDEFKEKMKEHILSSPPNSFPPII